MGSPRMRPVFVRPLHHEPAAFTQALRDALAARDLPVRGETMPDVSILRIRADQRHVWSPALHLSTEPRDGGGWQLHGRFSPSSPVWTAFLAIYLALVCVALGAACWGCAQWMAGDEPWALLGVPVALALGAFTYGAAFLGQGLGADDMYRLRAFVDQVAGPEESHEQRAG